MTDPAAPNSPSVAVLLTPAGAPAAAIAVIRLAGRRVGPFVARHFSKRTPVGRCVHGNLHDAGEIIDDAVVVTSAGGNVADVNVHGGAWVVQSVLDFAQRAGFEIRDVQAVPDVAHDLMNGSSELEREMLESLPGAKTELALRVLLAQPKAWGALVRRPEPAALRRALEDRALTHLLSQPSVAIVGAPNVGKSTLANQLFAHERSITADVPGTTRDWVGEVANLDGLAVMLLDTPGVRQTPDPIEREAIDLSRDQVRRAELVVLVLDATRPLAPEQQPLLDAYPNALRVINKVDRPLVWDADETPAIRTVATSGQGIDALRAEIRRFFGCLNVPIASPRVWTERQRRIVERALDDPDVLREISTG